MSTDPIHAIAAKRWTIALILSALMLVVYLGFILLVAFGKPLLSILLTPGLSLGIFAGRAYDHLLLDPFYHLRGLGQQPI